MESAKSTMAVALADELAGKGWQRSRKRIRVVAVLCSLLAALVMYGLFDRFRVATDDTPKRQTIAEVDLRIGNPAGAAERGEARARADIAAGELKLQMVGWPVDKAEVAQAKKLYGVAWVFHSSDVSPLTMAFMDAYNRVMYEEIRRKHGDNAVDRFRRLETAMMRREG